ncbi:hypothetical protein D3C80_2010410 [compost metagenome]
MLAHGTGHATAACGLAHHVATVAHMGTGAGGIGFEVVRAQQLTGVLQHPRMQG